MSRPKNRKPKKSKRYLSSSGKQHSSRQPAKKRGGGSSKMPSTGMTSSWGHLSISAAALAAKELDVGPVERGRIYFKLSGQMEFIELVSDIDLPVEFLKDKNRLIIDRKE